MKAAQINEYGDATAIAVVEIEPPAAGGGQVLVEVHASSLNPFDSTVRSGAMKDMIPLKLPVTLGGDIAGVVTEVGAGVEGLAAGDKIYGQAAVVASNSGALAEFAATKASQVAAMPEGLSFEEAAALPLVGVSALQALTEHLRLATGQKLFVHGGAGGIGRIAVQIAKHLGAYVAVTATGQDVEAVKLLGADEVVDYQTEDFADQLHDYDAVFDTVGRDDFARALRVLRRGGKAVSMIARPDEALAQELGVTALMQQTHVTTAALTELAELVEGGVVKPFIGKTFPLDEVVAAFQARESGVSGKVVVQIASS